MFYELIILDYSLDTNETYKLYVFSYSQSPLIIELYYKYIRSSRISFKNTRFSCTFL